MFRLVHWSLQKNAKVVSIDGYEDVPKNDEKSLQKAVAHQPVSVAIEAGGREFQLYKSVNTPDASSSLCLSNKFAACLNFPFDHSYRVSLAEGAPQTLTMVWSRSVMAPRMARTSGSSATHGVLSGVRLGTSAWSATSMPPLGSVELL